jgi:hypothetical protein
MPKHRPSAWNGVTNGVRGGMNDATSDAPDGTNDAKSAVIDCPREDVLQQQQSPGLAGALSAP